MACWPGGNDSVSLVGAALCRDQSNMFSSRGTKPLLQGREDDTEARSIGEKRAQAGDMRVTGYPQNK